MPVTIEDVSDEDAPLNISPARIRTVDLATGAKKRKKGGKKDKGRDKEKVAPHAITHDDQPVLAYAEDYLAANPDIARMHSIGPDQPEVQGRGDGFLGSSSEDLDRIIRPGVRSHTHEERKQRIHTYRRVIRDRCGPVISVLSLSIIAGTVWYLSGVVYRTVGSS